jgi:hypothetical protein
MRGWVSLPEIEIAAWPCPAFSQHLGVGVGVGVGVGEV